MTILKFAISVCKIAVCSKRTNNGDSDLIFYGNVDKNGWWFGSKIYLNWHHQSKRTRALLESNLPAI